MKIIADLHTHTISSGHAYSTLAENCKEAEMQGLCAIAVTDHTPAMPGGPDEIYFRASTPRTVGGVRVLDGAEVNVLGWDENYTATPWGDLTPYREAGGHNGMDMPDRLLERLEYVIASVHGPLCRTGTVEENTAVWLRILDNTHVDCLGHIDRYFPCDFVQIVKKCSETGTLIELNNHSVNWTEGAIPRIEEIAGLCKKYSVSVAVTSDAHHMEAVGRFPHILALLERINFPEELVVNADEKRLGTWLASRGVTL